MQGADGNRVLSGKASVKTADGNDLSEAFVSGAETALARVRQHDIQLALLKSNSPSCGNEQVYNGHFNGVLVRGVGVTTALLRQYGVQVYNELQIDGLELALKKLQSSPLK